MANIQLFIGIDPDVDKSGVAIYNPTSKALDLELLSFFQLLEKLQSLKNNSIQVVIEAGWLNKKVNYRKGVVKNGQFIAHSKTAGEQIANAVGRNAEVGRKIEEMCQYLHIPYRLVKPRRSKVKPHYFKALTGKATTSQELIDAAMLVFSI